MYALRKMLASVSAMAVLAGAVVLPVSAAEGNAVSVEMASAVTSAMEEANKLQAEGLISDAERAMLQEQIENVMAEGDTFVPPKYNYFSSYNLATTPHYIAIMADSAGERQVGNLGFYVNANILSSNYLYIPDRLFVSEEVADYISIEKLYESSSGANKVIYGTMRSTSDSKKFPVSEGTVIYSYKLGGMDSKTVTDEYNVHEYTSVNDSHPSDEIFRSRQGDSYVKCVYALGDTNRDGVVDQTDCTLILKYTIGSVDESDPLDVSAFKLAADVDRNGTVSMVDMIALNSYITQGEPLD